MKRNHFPNRFRGGDRTTPRQDDALRVVVKFSGRRFQLAVSRTDAGVDGHFVTDGRLSLAVDFEEPLPVVVLAPTLPALPEVAARDEVGEVSPLTHARRTVVMDEQGEPAQVEWATLTATDFATETSSPSKPLVPARSRKLPSGRCDEYYDHAGRLCQTVWTAGD